MKSCKLSSVFIVTVERKEFCKRPYKRRNVQYRPLCYFVGSKLIHPANPLMYEANPARSPLIALSCLLDAVGTQDLRPCVYIVKCHQSSKHR